MARWERVNRGTTEIGYVNRNERTVVRNTSLPGTDFGQVVYVLKCGNCGREHGANGSDIFQRRCPYCDQRSRGADLLRDR
jgi:DNA-directed RNA polymerase subunit RPC12/RpoP